MLASVFAVFLAGAAPAGGCSSLHAQVTRAAAQARDSAAARTRPARTAQPAPSRRDSASVSRSVSEKIFDADWVIFPARLAVVIVFLAVAVLFLMGGCWAAVRVAHSLRHTKWAQPPRRLKRGEIGAAGTSFAMEFEERLHENLERDAKRDQEIANLRDMVDQLSREQSEVAAIIVSVLQANREGASDEQSGEDGALR